MTDAINTPPAVEPLPLNAGRAARIVLLAYGDLDTDNRVLKSAASLQEAGAEVLLVGLAPYRSDRRPGPATLPSGLRIHRTQDLDLTRTFAGAARAWRRWQGRDQHTGATLPLAADPPVVPAPEHKGVRPAGTTGAAARVRRRVVDAYMRAYQTVRLGRYWVEATAVTRRFGADVVQANDGNTLGPALAVRWLDGTRLVYDSHELWLRRNVRTDRWLAPFVEAVLEWWGVRLADAVLTVSPSIVQWLQEHYHPAATPVLVRNIPVWPGRVPDRSSGRLRELAGLSERHRVLSYCGGITRGRGLEETIGALALLGEDTHLVLLGFGNPAYLSALMGLAERAGVRDRVHLVPPVPGPDVPQTLADADAAIVYVRPVALSYRYALPNKLFESIHAGLPIVAADLPDIAAVVRELDLGAVFAGGEPAELAAAIDQVLSDREHYRESVRRAASSFDWAQEVERLVRAHGVAVRRCRP